jgi:preprotein translocase subunit SecE
LFPLICINSGKQASKGLYAQGIEAEIPEGAEELERIARSGRGPDAPKFRGKIDRFCCVRTEAEQTDKGDNMGKLVQFVKESYAELRKVIWPGRDDVVSSVKVVIVSTVLIAGILGLVDILLLLGVQAIFQ